jgi:hypothetical protein
VITRPMVVALLLLAANSSATRAENALPDFYPPVHADVVPATLSDVLDIASIVARVRLKGRTPINLLPRPGRLQRPTAGPGLGASCGYLYRATVVDSIKGPDKDFEFFSSEDKDFTDLGHDYFVIVFEHKGSLQSRAFLNPSNTLFLLSESETRSINCLLDSKYYVGRTIQTMYSFDSSAAPNEALRAPNRYAPIACFSNRRALSQVAINWSALRGAIKAYISEGSISPC